MLVLDKLVSSYKEFDTDNTLEYKVLIDSLSDEQKNALYKEIEDLDNSDIQDLTEYFKKDLSIDLPREFVVNFLKENPELACIVKDGKVNSHFEQDYMRSLFCFYLGIQPWPLAVCDAQEKDAFFKSLIEKSITMNFSFVKQIIA